MLLSLIVLEKKKEKETTYLLSIQQSTKETLRQYVDQF